MITEREIPPTPNRTARICWFLALLLFVGIPIAANAFLSAQAEKARADVQSALTAICELKAREISNWLAERRGDARGSLWEIEPRRLLRNPSEPNRERATECLKSKLEAYGYRSASIYDANGDLILAVNDSTNKTFKSLSPQRIAEGLKTKTYSLTDLYRDSDDAPVRMDVIVPIKSSPEAQGPAIGLLVYQIDPERFLFPALRSWPIPSQTGETILLRRDGDQLVYLNELRTQKNSSLKMRIPLTRTNVVGVQAVTGSTGLLHGLDYRNEKVLAVYKTIPDTAWTLGAKIDEREGYHPIYKESRLKWMLIIAVIALFALGLYIVFREQKLHFTRAQLRERTRTDAAISRRLEFEQLLTRIQALILDTEASRLDEAICASLRLVCEFFGSDRASLWIGTEEEPKRLRRSHIWTANNAALIPEGVFANDLVPWVTKRLLDGQNVTLNSLDDLPPEAQVDRENFRRFGSKSALIFPFQAGSPRVFGAVAVAAPPTISPSSEVLSSNCQLLAQIFSGALARANAEKHRQRALSDLQTSEARYRRLFEEAAEGICVHDRSGKVLDVNRTFCNQLGYTREQLLTMSVQDFEADWKPRHLDDLWREIRSNNNPIVNGRLRRADGSEFPVEVHITLFEHGETEFFYASIRDVSERFNAEHQIHLLSQAVEQSPVSIVITGRNGCIEYVNRHFATVTGYSSEEALGANPRLLRSGQMDSAFYNEMWSVISSGKEWNGEFLNRRKSGSLFWERAVISPVKDKDNSITHYIAVKEDITEQKLIQDKLLEQARLIDEAHDAIILSDPNGNIRMWNKGAETMFGWKSSDVLEKSLFDILEGNPIEFAEANEALQNQSLWAGELNVRSRTGAKMVIASRWTLFRKTDRSPDKVLTIAHDVSAQKDLETQLLRGQRLQTLGELAAGIAHDLNNVLSPFLIGLPIIQEEVSNEDTKRFIAMMMSSFQRGTDLVKQLLLFGRGGDTTFIPLNLNRTVREVDKIIRETFPKNISFKSSWPPDLRVVSADPTQVYQILLNLCVNARDAMPDGGELQITLQNAVLAADQLAFHPKAKLGAYVVLSVRDTGSGMPPHVLERIFEPFFTTKEIGKGTGLGLAVALGVAERHGGFITVDSTVGVGSEFKIFLPALRSVDSDTTLEKKPNLARGNGELILLVEDEDAIREVLTNALERNGYKVLAVRDGVEAMTVHAEHSTRISVVVTDYSMPRLNGLAVASAMRKCNPATKIIITTGLAHTLDKQKLQDIGIDHVLPKPFPVAKLLETLRLVCSNSRHDPANNSSRSLSA